MWRLRVSQSAECGGCGIMWNPPRVTTLLLQLATVLASLSLGYTSIDGCNETLLVHQLHEDDEGRVTFELDRVRSEDRDKPLYCWFRFEGSPAQIIEVDVKSFSVGEYNPGNKDCHEGYLRISDQASCSTDPEWLPPTTLCGRYKEGQVRVRRLTRSPSAFVEFKLDKAKSARSFQFDVAFLDKDSDERLPFGDLRKTAGRIKNTKCDWLVPVEPCFGGCHIISPGYPGIYPPNTRCRYLFTNFADARVELIFGGRGFTGKFDMKKSENCSEDYIAVYDGMSSVSPLIRRYCGMDGGHVISSGSSLLMIFQSGAGGPQWDYSGFDMLLQDRWKHDHDPGTPVEGKQCDWLFLSRDEITGDLHTPDHMTQGNMTCQFVFSGRSNERIELTIVIVALDSDCSEYVEVFDGRNKLDKICDSRLESGRGLRDRRQKFLYNSTSPNVTVRYVRERPQTSNPEPVWLDYAFRVDPNAQLLPQEGATRLDSSERRPQSSGVVAPGSAGSSLLSTHGHLFTMAVMALQHTLKYLISNG